MPSLPGFGFSDAPREKGYGVAKMASTINALMIYLGYDKYSKFHTKWIDKKVAVDNPHNS